jgi:hypothetical protein
MRKFVIACSAMALVAGFAPVASAAGFCQLPDGTMGLTCVVAGSGQVYGCVKDLKDCGALLAHGPGGTAGQTPASGSVTPVPPASPSTKPAQSGGAVPH